MRVLHLDDDPMQRALIGRLLGNANFSVESCSCLAEASGLLDQFQFCVAVVDLGLDDQNGMDFVEELANRKLQTKTIVHSASTRFESARQGIELGIFAYVEKERGITHLLQQVERAASAYLVESHTRAELVSIIGQMANTIAHEVNQPLFAINNYAGGMLLGLTKSSISVDELSETIVRIQKEANRAGEIISRLRNYGFRTKMSLVELDVSDLIAESIKIVEFVFREHRIEVEVKIDNSPLVVKVDRVQLTQVLVNILKNAAEAMATVEISRRKCFVKALQRESHFEIEVQDEGPAEEPSKLSTLFEPYYSTKAQGVGLGLSICKAIMEDHGGSISLERRQPYGMTVRVSLPLRKPSSHPTERSDLGKRTCTGESTNSL